MARRAGRYYRTNMVGKRRIDRPVRPLKQIQRRIHDELLRPLPLPPTMLGGVQGRSIADNARPHVGQSCVVRIDLRDCYRRITHKQVYRTLAAHYPPSTAGVLTKLTTLKGALPQGAPTSPLLANHCLLALHEEVAALAREYDLRFTQWIDDFVLSGERAAQVIDAAIAAIRRHGHGVRCRKIKRMGRGVPQMVTGVCVNRKPSVGRARIEAIRKRMLEPDVDERWLRGSIAFVRGVNKEQGRKLEQLAARLGL